MTSSEHYAILCIESNEGVDETMKTRIAYGTHVNKLMYTLCNTIEESSKANMTVSEYEADLIALNPQLDIVFIEHNEARR